MQLRIASVISLLLFYSACKQRETASSVKLIGGKVPQSIGELKGIVFLGKVCSGAKIGSRHFLTAAHCFYGPEFYQHKSLDISYGLLLDDQAKKITTTIKKVHLHPDYLRKTAQSSQDNFDVLPDSTHDISIVEVEEETMMIEEVKLNFDSPKAGDFATISGYGKEYDRITGEPQTLAPRRQKYSTNTITVVGQKYFNTSFQDQNGDEARVASGDSGGPVYSGSLGSTSMGVIGVNAYKHPSADIYSAHTRLDLPEVKSWIEAVLSGSKEPDGRSSGELQSIDWANLKELNCKEGNVSLNIIKSKEELLISAHKEVNRQPAELFSRQKITLKILDVSPPAAIFYKDASELVLARGFGNGRQAVLHYRDGFKFIQKVVSNCNYEILERAP